MNYDAIILELLSRIQVLEKRVQELEEHMSHNFDEVPETDIRLEVQSEKKEKVEKIRMQAIRFYIENLKMKAAKQGESCLILKASDIHRDMKLKSRFPMVCNAMRQCMGPQDKIIHAPPSGYSSTLEISYCLTESN